jgi:hypothetical protein
MEEKRLIKPGDFIKRNNKDGSFMIFEGKNISETTYKRLTLVCEYDPEKYMMTEAGYSHVPHLDMGTPTKRCEATIDTEREDYWISLCSDEERLRAERILLRYGYEWDAENLRMIDLETGEIVKKIITPDDTYYGQIIKPISDAFKAMLKRFCITKNKPTYSPQYGYNGGGEYGWDGYED